MWWLLLVFSGFASAQGPYRPCAEVAREFRFPCACALGPIEPSLDNNPAIYVNCDRIVFAGDLPSLPYGAPVVSFSQRWVGHQALPTQIFSTNGLPLRSIDLSGNLLRRLTERLLNGVQTTLVELKLADNLLGDTLNPIFSTSEFRGLVHLQSLDLSGNVIKAIEEGMLEGCANLQELVLNANSLTAVPSSSLNGPKALRSLFLINNRIGSVRNGAFQAQPYLEKIDLTRNLIHTVEGGAFDGLNRLKLLRLSHNRLSRFNSDVFHGIEGLHYLDLSENFISEFPSIALKVFTGLHYLNLSSNLIQSLDNNDLRPLSYLHHLDLSRNSITNIVPGVFLGLKQLRRLDISVNSLRTIEDDAFEGLDNLEQLNLKDNNILLIPASALGRLPRLTVLQLDYNRVAALSEDILRSIAARLTRLVLAKNVVRELPPASFHSFHHLLHLDLTRNLIATLNTDAFAGLERNLRELRLGQNRITNLVGPPLALLELRSLDLSDNHLTELSRNVFGMLPQLTHLNLSHNEHLTNVASNLLHKLPNLERFDMSSTGLKLLTVDFFSKSIKMVEIYLRNNALSEVGEAVFANLPNLTTIDLSDNHITNIKPAAFVNIRAIKTLSLRGNQLSSFKGELFNTGTGLESLDISHNQLSYLFPSSFRIHPRLRHLSASHNKFNFFPAELIASLQFLELVDLSSNELKVVEELDFARLPRLRTLRFGGNQLESVSEMAFHNSTQLQVLDLSYNRLERLGERTFEGLVRLEVLNLEGNRLVDLPETIFERARLQALENINLAHNLFQLAPLKALQRQYFFLSSVDLSHNKIVDIPAEDSIMVNIKKLDLSFNALSPETVRNVLGEPKTIRELNLAATGIHELHALETPFLSRLNLSYNSIAVLTPKMFERTTLLESLDLSNNRVGDLSAAGSIWTLLKNLQSLNISSNRLGSIPQAAFQHLEGLRHLAIASQPQCERIEKSAFKSLANLASLEAYDYPKLGYVDVQGLLSNMPALERVDVETKDAALGADQLGAVLHPRVQELGLYGPRLRSLSSGTFSGLKGPRVQVRLRNTSLTALPAALFFPVPRSSRIELDVGGSQLATLSAQILAAVEDRRGDLTISGLESNPISCDCGARALRRWRMTSVRCTAPEHLAGRLLAEVGDDELTCDAKRLTTTTTTARSTSRTVAKKAPTEPEIIWSVPAVTEAAKPKVATSSGGQLNNDDTLIIGIVGGVVAFIAILIIVICIIRLRMSGREYRGPPGGMMAPGVMGAGGSSCACSVKGAPVYPMGYTLPHKMHAGTLRPASNYSTMGRVPYYQGGGQQQQQQPYFIAVSNTDESKIYR